VHVDERLPLGVEELEPLPVLCVGGQLQAGVSVGGVVLDVELVLLERSGFLFAASPDGPRAPPPPDAATAPADTVASASKSRIGLSLRLISGLPSGST
jgi:hypothetical protein